MARNPSIDGARILAQSRPREQQQRQSAEQPYHNEQIALMILISYLKQAEYCKKQCCNRQAVVRRIAGPNTTPALDARIRGTKLRR